MSPSFRLPLVVAVLSLAVLALPAGPPPSAGTPVSPLQRITAEGMLRDVAALSADSMEGRGPGTAGDRMARAYLARRLA